MPAKINANPTAATVANSKDFTIHPPSEYAPGQVALPPGPGGIASYPVWEERRFLRTLQQKSWK